MNTTLFYTLNNHVVTPMFLIIHWIKYFSYENYSSFGYFTFVFGTWWMQKKKKKSPLFKANEQERSHQMQFCIWLHIVSFTCVSFTYNTHFLKCCIMRRTPQMAQDVSAMVNDVHVVYVYIETNAKAVQWNQKTCSVWTVTKSGISTNASSWYTKYDFKTAFKTLQSL